MFKTLMFVFAFSLIVSAQSVYDYKTKSYLSSTKSGNSTTTYDYNTKSYSTSTTGASGTTTYDYGTHSYSTTKKTPGGYSTYNYGTRKQTDARATGNNSYTISSESDRDRKSSVVGIIGSR